MSTEIAVKQSKFAAALRAPSAHSVTSPPIRYGLPCASCRLYYSAELNACPICQCTERVSPVARHTHWVVRL